MALFFAMVYLGGVFQLYSKGKAFWAYAFWPFHAGFEITKALGRWQDAQSARCAECNCMWGGKDCNWIAATKKTDKDPH